MVARRQQPCFSSTWASSSRKKRVNPAATYSSPTSRSRCVTLMTNAESSASRSASSRARATDRCRPPVQPMASTSRRFCSATKRGARKRRRAPPVRERPLCLPSSSTKSRTASSRPRQGPKPLHPVGIGQETRVEHHVGLVGQSVLVSERHDAEEELAAQFVGEQGLLDAAAQVAGRHVGRVYHQVGLSAEIGQQPALALDAFTRLDRERGCGRRVDWNRFTKASSEASRNSSLKAMPDSRRNPRASSEVLEVADRPARRRPGHPINPAALQLEQLDDARQHLRGKVVDAEVAGILEGGHGLGLACPGQPGDHGHPVKLHGASLTADLPSPSQCAASCSNRRGFQAGSLP